MLAGEPRWLQTLLQNRFGRFFTATACVREVDVCLDTCLKSTGKAAVNRPHGVLFRGGAEATIRREIVRRGYIKGIISLPPNLFYGTGIPACIVVVDKKDAQTRKGIF